jgi:hypothetical protein
VKRVYLDQNHWVALTRARLGRPDDDNHLGVLALVRAAVEQGEASFPLSMSHYIETQNRRDWRSRSDIAVTMGEISKFHAIAPHNRLIDAEIEHALGRAFGFQAQAPIIPFGYGAAFHSAASLPDYVVPDELVGRLPEGVKWQLEERFKPMREQWLLSGVPPDIEEELQRKQPEFDPRAPKQAAAKYALEQESVRAERLREGWNKGDRAKRWFAAGGFTDNFEVIDRILRRERIDARRLYDLEMDGMNELMRDIPTLHASVEFQRNRHVSSQKPIEPSDAGDQLAIPPALVYCDIVVTERQHATGMRKLKLDEHFGTVVIHQLDELPRYLV